ncbi:MAG: ComF family protein [Epsilonproteobacteria bacterium]|nr:ComF family protein [Campylobacterota bacterium]
MRCFSCDSFSIEPICKSCVKDFLTPHIITREIDGVEVISFFDYFLINEYIKSKYSASGYRIYKFFGKKFFNPFLKEYIKNLSIQRVYLIGVDGSLNRGYSNVALLLRYGSLGIKNLKPLYNALRAKRKVQYAGKPLEFRLKNPREFVYKGPKNIEAILVDDTITTGTTLKEAIAILKENSVNIHFALTLASTQDGIDY